MLRIDEEQSYLVLLSGSRKIEKYALVSGVQGKPGVDFPVYARIPKTTFTCKELESGYYADLETSCQVTHNLKKLEVIIIFI